MKKSKFKIILYLLLIIYPIKTLALTQNISITCDKSQLRENETTSCILKGYTNKIITSLEAKLSSDSSLEISNIKLLYDWQGIEDLFLELYTDKDVIETFDIVSFDISSTKNDISKIYVKDIVFYNESFEGDSVNDYEFTFTESSKEEVQATSEVSNTPKIIENVPNTKLKNKIYIYCIGVLVILSIIFTIVYIYKSNKNKMEVKNEQI